MQNKSKRLTPLQMLLAVVIVVLIGIFRNSTQGSDLPVSVTDLAPITTMVALSETDVPEVQDSVVPTKSSTARKTTVPTSSTLKDFDYFVMALSWSPDYCATTGSNDEQQCSIGKKLTFVLHGLWPQNTKGYPSNCSDEKLPSNLKNEFAGLYPSDSLFDHEWEKHGTCTGLSAEQYLALSKQLKSSIVLPEPYRSPLKAFRTTVGQLKDDFVSVNPDLSTDSMAVFCSGSGRYLKEMYVCLAKDGSPTACSSEVNKNASKSCQQSDILVRNTR
jgi:ribonuclease T2